MSAPVNLSVSRLVNFQSVITPQGVQAPALNTGLVIGTSAVIDVVTRMRVYQTLAQVAADFGTSAQEYLAAEAWFDQNPQPTQMNVGRWANGATNGQLFCAPLSTANSLVSAWTAVTAGEFGISVNGAAQNITCGTMAGVTTLQGVAAIIQTALRAIGTGGYAAATCTYDAVYNRFIITSGTTGTSSAVSFLTAGAANDISVMMNGQAADSGAYVANGISAESLLAAVVILDNMFGGQWYHEFAPSAADTDCEAIGPYFDGDATPHFQWYNSQETAMLAPNATTSIGYLMQQLLTQHTAIQYSSQSQYAAWSTAARIATVNWQGSLTAIALFYKQDVGVAAETLTASQITNLESYNVNVFVAYANGVPIIEPGICPSGQFIDTIVGVDWLRNQCATNVFNILFTQTTKIPQTDAGVNTLLTGVSQACGQGVTNGLLAPGVWNAGGFGTLQEGQTLPKGYYVYAPSVASQSEAQRAERVCPPIQVASKLAGAVDLVSGTIYVNQ